MPPTSGADLEHTLACVPSVAVTSAIEHGGVHYAHRLMPGPLAVLRAVGLQRTADLPIVLLVQSNLSSG